MGICFNNVKTDCYRTEWTLMDHGVVNYGQLPVFFKEIPKSEAAAFYKIKLIFLDNTEGDSTWYKTNNNIISDVVQYNIPVILLSLILVINVFLTINIIVKIFVKRKCESSCIKVNM